MLSGTFRETTPSLRFMHLPHIKSITMRLTLNTLELQGGIKSIAQSRSAGLRGALKRGRYVDRSPVEGVQGPRDPVDLTWPQSVCCDRDQQESSEAPGPAGH